VNHLTAVSRTIRDGVPDSADTWGAAYDTAVWKALNSTALSAQEAEYDYARWTYLLDEAASHLGWQARLSGGRKDRSLQSYRRRLRTTWEDAETYPTANPRRGDDEIAAIIAAARALADDPRAGLTDNQANVLRSACDLAAKYGDHGTARPALPLPTLEGLTGLSRRSVLNALASLGAPSKTRPRARGLLVRDRRGDVRRHLAALYRLPDLAACAAAVTPPAQGEARRSGRQGYVPSPHRAMCPPQA
jgi:hypothetical protein